ncbi:MAG: hypothetical protein SFX72_01985 [Isosphaeraceae bacterium]|nr:hypothetical protein [Isosphaeraceae bacterium]
MNVHTRMGRTRTDAHPRRLDGWRRSAIACLIIASTTFFGCGRPDAESDLGSTDETSGSREASAARPGSEPLFGGELADGVVADEQPASIPLDPAGPKPRAGSGPIRGRVQLISGIEVVRVVIPADSTIPCIFWSSDGTRFFTVGRTGVVRKIRLEGLLEESLFDAGMPAAWLAPSAKGLVLTPLTRDEVWILDESTLELRARFPIPPKQRVVSSRGSRYGFVIDPRADRSTIVDLESGKWMRSYERDSFGKLIASFANATLAPDGRWLYTRGIVDQLLRFRVEGDRIGFSAASPRISKEPRQIAVSETGARVALVSLGGNHGFPADHTAVFRSTDLDKAEVVIATGSGSQAIGFDDVSGKIYAQNEDQTLIVFSASGGRERSLDLATRGGETRQLAVHPRGGKVLVLGAGRLDLVTLP